MLSTLNEMLSFLLTDSHGNKNAVELAKAVSEKKCQNGIKK